MMYLHRNCEGIDAAVFSGDLLYDSDKRDMLKGYMERWLRAVGEHELQDVKERAHRIDPECWISYSGKPKEFKQQMDARRLVALNKAKEMT